MSEENDKDERGFRVTDRRIRFDTEDKSEGPSEKAAATSNDTSSPMPGTESTSDPSSAPRAVTDVVEGPGWQMKKKSEAAEECATLPPMDFTRFCLSLASSALIYMGETDDPETGAPQADPALAKQTIDILAMLEEKTRGNLTDAESKLLSTILYDLRMRFLQKPKN